VQWEAHLPILGRVEKIYIQPPIDTGIYSDNMLVEYERRYQDNPHYDAFGTVNDNRQGRYADFNEGDRHFSGLVPVESIKPVIASPRVYL
jgi:hypothetical protein